MTDSDEAAQPGTVTFLQHFGSVLNLHVLLYLLALDDLYLLQGQEEPLAFIRAPTPTVEQLERLVERTARRIRALVARVPIAPEPDEAQAPIQKAFGAEPREPTVSKFVAQFDGFTHHTGKSFEPHDRVAQYSHRKPSRRATSP